MTTRAAAAPPDFRWDIPASRFSKALVGLVLLGLIVRVGYFVQHSQQPSFGVPVLDEKYYDTVARMLLAGEDLHELRGLRPLLYPMFLAALCQVGGAWGATLAICVQHLLGVVTGLLVALLGAGLFRNRLCGWLGGALYLLAPVPLYFEGELQLESSYTFLIVAALWLHGRALAADGGRAAWLWFLGGGLVALAAQGRANILVFLAVYPLFIAWRWWRQRDLAALRPGLGLLGVIVMLIPWSIVNLKQSPGFQLLPGAGGVNLYLGNRRGADGMLVGLDVMTSLSTVATNAPGTGANRSVMGGRYRDVMEIWAREEYEAATRAAGREPEDSPAAMSRFWAGRTLAEMRAAPGGWFRLMARKGWLLLWNREIPNNKDFAFLQTASPWLRLLPVRWVVLLALFPAGAWAAAKWGSRDALLLLLACTALYAAGIIAFFICDRYRYPLWPALAVFAGGGMLAWVELVGRRRRAGVGIGAVTALLVALALHNWPGITLPNFAQDFYFRSVAWYEKRHLPEALADVNQSLRLQPGNAGALHHRGNVLFALNQLEAARATYEQALQLIPGNASLWNNLGAVLDAQGRPDAALEAFRHAMDLSVPSQTAFLGAAFVHIRQGQLAQAETALNRLEQLRTPLTAEILATRAVIQTRRGNIAEAQRLAQQARDLNAGVLDWVTERVGSKPPPQP
jgi:tetratricopeptide (TPR) repeat protein